MGQVSNTLPTILTQVTALGTGTKLTDYYNGGAGGISNTAGEAGFIPTSGTIELTDFKDATRVNCRGNIFFNVQGSGESSPVDTNNMVTFMSNGSLQYYNKNEAASAPICDVSGNLTYQDNENTTYYDREWLFLNTNPVLSTTANQWQIKVAKTAGNAAAPTDNNTWRAFPHSISCNVHQGGLGTNNKVINYSVQIRRADTLVVVHDGVMRLQTEVTRFFDG